MTIDSVVRRMLLIGLLLTPAALFGQNPNEEDPAVEEPVKDTGHLFQLSFKNRPSLRIGEFFRIDVKTKWHIDFRRYSPRAWEIPGIVNGLPSVPDDFFLRRARFGVKGSVTKWVDYEFERDFRATFDRQIYNEWHPWKDNYVNFKLHRLLNVRVGKQRIPFGMEENRSEDHLDYAFKSATSDTLAPSRARGVVLHADFTKGKRLTYEAGVFREDGDNADIHGIHTGRRTYAGRLSGEFLRNAKVLPKTLRHMYFGVAATRGEMVEGLNGVKGGTYSGFTFLDHMFVRGQRTRLGAEAAWTEGPFSLQGEYIHMSEERKQEGVRGEDLPDKISRGYYVAASWTALGKMKSKGGAPKKAFITGGGIGAVELTARYDILAFYSAPGSGLASRSPRAPTILPNGERIWTVGPTWYLNKFFKIQVNAQREHVTDIERKAVLGINTFWTGIIRIQGAM